MSPATDDAELTHLWALRKAKRDRLFALEEQAAVRGNSAPPEVTIEIAQLRHDIELLEMRLQTAEPAADTRAAIGVDGRLTVAEFRIKAVGDKLGDALTFFGSKLDAIERHLERQDDRIDRLVAAASVALVVIVLAVLLGGIALVAQR